MICSNCDTESADSSMFCATCGFPLASNAPSSGFADGISPRKARLLCYSFWWVSGIVFLFLKKSDKIIRFHAWQSIITFGLLSLIILTFNLLPPISNVFVYSVAAIVYWIVLALSIILWIFLMFTNYRGQMHMLPVAGSLAQKILELHHPGCFAVERIRCAGNRARIGSTGVVSLFNQQSNRDLAGQSTSGHTATAPVGKPASITEPGQIKEQKPASQQAVTRAGVLDSFNAGSNKLKVALDGAVKAVACTAELRDAYTAAHQQRVARLSLFIAREMGLSEEQVEATCMAASIHDVGKICIPAEILSKPGRLTGEEFSIVKTHCQAGYDILKTIDFPFPVAQIVLQHHERMDGSGYPSGISGDDILLEARVLSVADVVEAMSTHRPYRPALGEQKALDEIKKNRGILYDSCVVDACVGVVTRHSLDSLQQ